MCGRRSSSKHSGKTRCAFLQPFIIRAEEVAAAVALAGSRLGCSRCEVTQLGDAEISSAGIYSLDTCCSHFKLHKRRKSMDKVIAHDKSSVSTSFGRSTWRFLLCFPSRRRNLGGCPTRDRRSPIAMLRDSSVLSKSSFLVHHWIVHRQPSATLDISHTFERDRLWRVGAFSG